MVAVRVTGLRKAFGGVVAVDGMDLDVAASSIHAVVGENGAGKSTVMKALAGAVRPDAGTIELDATAVELTSAEAARRLGVGIVHQELSILPERPLLANLFVNRQPRRHGLVDRGAMARRARPALERLGLDVDPAQPVGQLSIAERQLIELARVLLEEPRLLILDEPNSALNARETERLFTILRELAAAGITVLYVSHRLEEVFEIADHVTVMRDGRRILAEPTSRLTIPRVVEAMVGARQEELFPPRRSTPVGDDGLVVHDLTVGSALTGVSFRVAPGEIVGLAGIAGSGVELLLGVLFGDRRASAGAVTFPDGRALPTSPTQAVRRGVSLVPADRRTQGLMLERTVATNVVHVAVGAMPARNPWWSRRASAATARRQIDRLGIRADGPEAPVAQLSGGNQQKVVLAKWLEVAPSVVILDDPTRGVDVGAKHEIYALIRQLAEAGRVVLLRSTELPEVIGLSDRILVFYRGRLAAQCRASDVGASDLLRAVNTGELSTDTEGVRA